MGERVLLLDAGEIEALLSARDHLAARFDAVHREFSKVLDHSVDRSGGGKGVISDAIWDASADERTKLAVGMQTLMGALFTISSVLEKLYALPASTYEIKVTENVTHCGAYICPTGKMCNERAVPRWGVCKRHMIGKSAESAESADTAKTANTTQTSVTAGPAGTADLNKTTETTETTTNATA